MRIVIDLQACQSSGSRNRGIGRYSKALVQAMAARTGAHELWLAVNGNFLDTISQIRRDFSAYLPAERIVLYEVPSSVKMLEPRNDWRRNAAERIREYALASLNPDIIHVSSLFEGLGEDAVTSIGRFDTTTPTTVTLYDLIPLINAETYLDNTIVRTWYNAKLESLKKADVLLAISESSRQEALSVLGMPSDKVVTVSTAVDAHFQPVDLSVDQVQQLRSRYSLNRPFVMYTGGIDTRKNIEGLIEAYSQLPAEIRCTHQLAIVCSIKPHERNLLMAVVKRCQLTPADVILTGFVSEDDLVALYNLCELFIFPSLHEGFGLPALEAMSCGAVVMGSNASSIPEVIGRSDALFDPTSTEQITQAIYKGLSDQALRQSLRDFAPLQAAKFSWVASAKKTLDAFEQLHEKERSTHRVQVQVSMPKPKLAFFSPLPPEQSGIANYSAELFPILAKDYDITLITVQSVDVVELKVSPENSFEIQSVEWFESHAESFERRVYQFGNSDFHHYMFDLLERYPGAVVLHDFYLSGVLHWMDVVSGPPGTFAHALYRSHGYSALSALFQSGPDTTIYDFPCNQAVLEAATGVIVHSPSSKDLAAKWYGESASSRWRVIPQLHPVLPQRSSKQAARETLRLKKEDFLICSFGALSPTKLNHRLLSSWLKSGLASNKRCHLVFVGENNSEGYGRQLLADIEAAGVSDRIKITGFASTQMYQDYLAAADVAVQLRAFSRGETSRAVLEVLLHRLPLILNAHGTMADYPEDISLKLPDKFSDEQLTESLERLHAKDSLREDIAEAGYHYVTKNHSPDMVGQLYREAMETFTFESPYGHYQQLLTSLQAIDSPVSPGENDLRAAAESIARVTEYLGQPQLLIDVTSWMEGGLTTQNKKIVQTSVLSLLKQTGENPFPETYRVEPIYSDGKVYRYARQFTLKLLGLSVVHGLEDDPVDISKQDLFLGIDTPKMLTAESSHRLMSWHQIGVKVCIAMFAGVTEAPISKSVRKPENSSEDWAQTLLNISDLILCASPELADRIRIQLEDKIVTPETLPQIECFFPTGSPESVGIDFLSLIACDIF